MAKNDTVIPEPLGINLKSSALTIDARCGQCRHFQKIAYPAYGKICKQKGILETNKPCKYFFPDHSLIKIREDKALARLLLHVSMIPKSKLPLLAAVLNREARTRKQGLHFGQKVYFKAFERDYISNYVSGRVVSADSKYVHLEGGDYSGTGKTFSATLLRRSILSGEQWKRKRKELKDQRREVDPNFASYHRTSKTTAEIKKMLEKIDVPNIDTYKLRKTGIFESFGKPINPNTTPVDSLMKVRGGEK